MGTGILNLFSLPDHIMSASAMSLASCRGAAPTSAGQQKERRSDWLRWGQSQRRQRSSGGERAPTSGAESRPVTARQKTSIFYRKELIGLPRGLVRIVCTWCRLWTTHGNSSDYVASLCN